MIIKNEENIKKNKNKLIPKAYKIRRQIYGSIYARVLEVNSDKRLSTMLCWNMILSVLKACIGAFLSILVKAFLSFPSL